MTLRLLAPHDRRGAWRGDDVFTDDPRFERRWWFARGRLQQRAWFAWGLVDDVEVARAELMEDTVDLSAWVATPRLGRAGLEITFLEVAADRRRAGVASTFVTMLAQQFPDRRLIALSEEADDFWGALGWTRHAHRDDDGIRPSARPAYIQPPHV